MKIGNIVSTSTVKAPEDFNVVKTMTEVIEGLPTLVIGYDFVDKAFPNFDITERALKLNVYWTFKRTEKRDKYEEDLSWFISNTYKELTDKLLYVFVDPIQYKSKSLIKIIRKISSLTKPITYVNGEMVYVYGDNIVFGIDLKLLRYMSVDVVKIKDKIKFISDEFLDDGKILIEYIKHGELLGLQARFIPYLYSIRNEQNNTTSLIRIP